MRVAAEKNAQKSRDSGELVFTLRLKPSALVQDK